MIEKMVFFKQRLKNIALIDKVLLLWFVINIELYVLHLLLKSLIGDIFVNSSYVKEFFGHLWFFVLGFVVLCYIFKNDMELKKNDENVEK